MRTFIQKDASLSAIEYIQLNFLVTFISVLIAMVAMLIGVAFLSLFERKLMGTVQYRLGPNKVSGFYGICQPFSDAIKLASKQNPFPNSGESFLYSIAPVAMCFIYLSAWCIPLSFVCPSSKGLIILLVLLSCSALWQAVSGWAAHSSFSEIGSIRAIAQSVSFEIILSMSMLTFMFLSTSSMSNLNESGSLWLGSLNLLVTWMLTLALLAESGRSPFDLPEGESELVGGYLVDYGGSLYMLIFLAENLSCLLIAGIMSFVCIHPLNWCKCLTITVIIILIRSAMPRISFRDMMPIVWIMFMPSVISAMSLSVIMI
uniref:NADH-ubiquinone oxidoreductase chain 1 n=1 Tax=Hoplopleura kitti TaxID=1511644 RepID=A0A075EB35_9NEOP|nr:NADH dehydrogenase subunit 1 [Hoplopleura kitti]